ncbi:alpha/beta hydrolase [Streptomyces sp. NBC_00377]|uniref:alpha/beta fold hydrolase n=1 Tax=unclassified Streptomyces TaxID=2593676 RepID=UPI002E21FC5A|nr:MULTISPECIES: alpha/beta hydrolase [unclassified Streptomyces]
MPYFTSPVDGARLHHVDHGPADGPVLVFVNSLYFGAEMWEYQMLPLAREGHRCVGFDRRGHGRSDDVWGGFDLDSLADDVRGLLDHLDLRDVTLVGHSVGAAEIVRCLTRHGTDRVARVALVAGMTPGPARSANHPEGVDPELLLAGVETFRRDRSAFFADGAHAFFALDRPGNGLSEAYVETMIRRCHGSTARAGVAIGELIAALDVAPELPALDLPVLVVHGTHDTSAPLELTGRRAAALAPRATLEVYENAGHGLFATHADRLTSDLRKFAAGA